MSDCENCDALCCVATKFKTLNYDKPARTVCKHFGQDQNRYPIFDRLEEAGFTFYRDFDCYSGGLADSSLFKELGKNWMSDPKSPRCSFIPSALSIFSWLNISTRTASSKSTCWITSSKSLSPSPSKHWICWQKLLIRLRVNS